MGTEVPNRPSYPVRPAATPFAAQQSSTPYLSSGSVAGPEASAFRSVPTAASQFPAPPFSARPLTGVEAPTFRPPPSSRPNELIRPPPSSSSSSSYGTPTSGFQHFPTPPMPSTGQVPPPLTSLTSQPVVPMPNRPSPGSVSLLSQPQPSSVPMGSPPQNLKTGQPNMNYPLPADQHFLPSRPNSQPSSPPTGPSYATGGTFQPAFPGYDNTQPNSVAQAPPVQSASFPLQQGSYGPPAPATPFLAQQRGYVPGPPISTPSGLYSGNQMQQHGGAPPLAGSQGLAEDFSSLSLGSVPGSFDAGVDTAALPRPLDGDVEPKSFADMYPLNCSSRFVRLTTSGIPNSQSLASRWHFPIGAVVCPLAEAPAGVSLHLI